MANRWENNGNSDRLYFLMLQITVDDDCNCEIRRCLFLGRKAMTNVDNKLKSRDIILPTEVHLVKAMLFPVTDLPLKWNLKNIKLACLWLWQGKLFLEWPAQQGDLEWALGSGRLGFAPQLSHFLPCFHGQLP